MAALIAALVTAVAMGAYAVIQYNTEPEATISDLVLRHGWHVLGLGVLIYLVLHLVLYRHVVRPISRVFVKCYAVSRGDLEPMEETSPIAEMRTIEKGINMMTEKLRQIEEGDEFEFRNIAKRMRRVADKLKKTGDTALQQEVLSIAGELEEFSSTGVN